MNNPRLEINCSKIHHNAHALFNRLGKKGISVTPVTKVCLGHPEIVQTLINAGADMIADSRIENIESMRHSGINVPMMLIRSPMLSQVSRVVQSCDISLNTELAVIKQLSKAASSSGRVHGVVIMIELGDLREGVMQDNLEDFIRQMIHLPNIVLKGIGTNLTCRYGVAPDHDKMSNLSDLADEIERKFGITLDIVSGGNSANLNWAFNNKKKNRINHLRVGEAIFLGCETLYQQTIDGLFTDAIILIAEVIESKEKPSLPWGDLGLNAFGEQQKTLDRGNVSQAILAIGRQYVSIEGLKPPIGVTIVASTSDHLIVETSDFALTVGQEVRFQLNYSALLSSMSSPFIHKCLIEN
ncbi:alanine/ornithine racemase family PLP-dependent enzyme [Photobacterium sp.]|uniref:alanine/ornithine racemase family PLP-dependent enzyme n=1 Tax=Photobacterium sp. TaxID=660 RepID=UPI00299D6160|nr:alanine/ornithine racemase family PLP-dependent enzyme [Photobacterium sp.]MDX1303611.1 alanine/ornithine racemase family PLP-dependent enzyme [Photobacterium sp.]